ncbi:MAG: hypothetical protein KC505_07885 [Myxococcales bacterium]|nr:hypothetical protein [Myxococcales bacterium]
MGRFVKILLVFNFNMLSLSLPMVAKSIENCLLEDKVSYGGRAKVLGAQILNIPLSLIDTQELPSEGGQLEDSLLEVGFPLSSLGTFFGNVLHATSIGDGNISESEASVADVGINLDLLGAISVKANFLAARAYQTCDNELFGVSEVAGLNINNKEVIVTGEKNQIYNLLVGRIIINEQIEDETGITVNALHIIVDGILDVVISSARAAIECRSEELCNEGDFITGGGWINVDKNNKGNFAIAGGIKNGNLWGHLNFVDHKSKTKIHGVQILSYESLDKNTRLIRGLASVNQDKNYTYEAIVSDYGEPGKSDTFWLKVENGLEYGEVILGGGNIQLHAVSCK